MIYGPLSDIEEQLNEKGYTLGKHKDKIQKIHFGLNMCHMHEILTDSEYTKAVQRLNKMIGTCAEPLKEVTQ